MICPVCSAKMEHSEDHLEHVLMEYTDRCKVCGYTEDYVTGATQIHIGHHDLVYNYLTPEPVVNRIEHIVEAYIPTARRFFIQRLLNLIRQAKESQVG